MRHIVKRAREPDALLQHRKSNPDQLNWDALSKEDKDSIRNALLEDQRYICCYCMNHTVAGTAKIEHYRSQSRYPKDALAWKNLLAVCAGGKDGPRHQQTCDTRKGNEDLAVNPLDEATLRSLRFLVDGRIRSELPEVEEDLNQRLNLNFDVLCRNRVAAVDGLKNVLKKKYGPGARWSKSHLEGELRHLREKNRYPPFVGVLEHWLTKAIRAR
jgi:uncharacterized protein (TIGR02646 family)